VLGVLIVTMKIKTALRTIRRLAMSKNMEHTAELIQKEAIGIPCDQLQKAVKAEERSMFVLDTLIERLPMDDDFILLTKDGARHSLNPKAFYHNGEWRDNSNSENDKRTKSSDRKNNAAT
jgi:hypothetical protein